MGKKHKHADAIIAWADGATIEYRTDAGMEWTETVGTITWCERFEYRVKREPREWWLVKKPGSLYHVMSDRPAYVWLTDEQVEVVHVREVLP